MVLASTLSVGPGAAAKVEALAVRMESWERLLAIAGANQVRPQLAAWLSEVPLRDPAALATRERLETVARASRGHGLMQVAEMGRALDALAAAGAPALPFKGPAFARLVADGRASREMSDLDVVIHPADIARAVAALAPLGYAPPLPYRALASTSLARAGCELGLTRPADGALLELHWRLGQSWYPVAITVEEAFARASPREILGVRISWPAPEELFLMHVSDAMKSCAAGVRWIADLLAILERHAELDWDRIESIAARNGALGTVALALAIVEDFVEATGSSVEGSAIDAKNTPRARTLAQRARGNKRLARARTDVLRRWASDATSASPGEHFRWAVGVADRPAHAALAVARHLSRPALADLVAWPARASERGLRWRALRRRLGRIAG